MPAPPRLTPCLATDAFTAQLKLCTSHCKGRLSVFASRASHSNHHSSGVAACSRDQGLKADVLAPAAAMVAAGGVASAMFGAGRPVHAPQLCGPAAVSPSRGPGPRETIALNSQACCLWPQRVQRTGHCSRHICGRSTTRGRDRRKPGLSQDRHLRPRALPPFVGRCSYGCTRCFSRAGSFDVTPMCGWGEPSAMCTKLCTPGVPRKQLPGIALDFMPPGAR